MSEKDFNKMIEISKSIGKMIRDRSAADSILVHQAWKFACGDIIFSRTRLLAIRKEEIAIEVQEDHWYKELQNIKDDLIRKLNEFLGNQRFKKISIVKRRGNERLSSS